MRDIIVILICSILTSCGGSKRVFKSSNSTDSSVVENRSTNEIGDTYVGKTTESLDSLVIVYDTAIHNFCDTVYTYVEVGGKKISSPRPVKQVISISKSKDIDTTKFLKRISSLEQENTVLKKKSTSTEKHKSNAIWWYILGVLTAVAVYERKRIYSSIKQFYGKIS